MVTGQKGGSNKPENLNLPSKLNSQNLAVLQEVSSGGSGGSGDRDHYYSPMSNFSSLNINRNFENLSDYQSRNYPRISDKKNSDLPPQPLKKHQNSELQAGG